MRSTSGGAASSGISGSAGSPHGAWDRGQHSTQEAGTALGEAGPEFRREVLDNEAPGS